MIIRCRKFVYISNYRLKIPIVNNLFSDRTDGSQRKSQNESLYYRWCIDLSIGTSREELFTVSKLPLPSVPMEKVFKGYLMPLE